MGGKFMEGVIDQEEIEIAVFVIVEESGLGGESGIVKAIFVCFIGKGAVTVVDIKQIFPASSISIRRTTDIDIEFPVAVDIDHGGSRAPALVGCDAAFLRDVFKGKVALVKI